jgi:hypothetical protein
MELRHLKYFVAVAEELNFARAARRVHIAQPSLTKQIQQLEQELGFPLLYRTRKKLSSWTQVMSFWTKRNGSSARQRTQSSLCAGHITARADVY